jgi:DNA-binding CsgD family transcriptional regulator
VLKVIREEGVYENGRRGTVPPEKTEAMVRMRADGMTYENIALQLGVSHMTVQNHLKARGEPATNVVRRRVERFDRDLARRLYAKGDPVVAIARRLDVSENSVYRAIKGAK